MTLKILLFFLFPIFASCDEIKRIVNGTNAPEFIAPYMVSIRLHYNVHLCGGSIINQNTVLTAAHCLTGLTKDQIFVVAGSTKLDSGGYSYDVTEFILHEDYNTSTLQHDIALVFVKQTFRYNDRIQPISLPYEDTKEGLPMIITGWGYTFYDPKVPGHTSNDLQLLYTKSLNNKHCQELVPTTIYDTQLCALNMLHQGACYGDSGSPLVTGEYQVGVVSWAYPCALETPDVYTRVYHYLPWIHQQVEKYLERNSIDSNIII